MHKAFFGLICLLVSSHAFAGSTTSVCVTADAVPNVMYTYEDEGDDGDIKRFAGASQDVLVAEFLNRNVVDGQWTHIKRLTNLFSNKPDIEGIVVDMDEVVRVYIKGEPLLSVALISHFQLKQAKQAVFLQKGLIFDGKEVSSVRYTHCGRVEK